MVDDDEAAVVVDVVERTAQARVEIASRDFRGLNPALTISMSLDVVSGRRKESAPGKANGGFGMSPKSRDARADPELPFESNVASRSETPTGDSIDLKSETTNSNALVCVCEAAARTSRPE